MRWRSRARQEKVRSLTLYAKLYQRLQTSTPHTKGHFAGALLASTACKLVSSKDIHISSYIELRMSAYGLALESARGKGWASDAPAKLYQRLQMSTRNTKCHFAGALLAPTARKLVSSKNIHSSPYLELGVLLCL